MRLGYGRFLGLAIVLAVPVAASAQTPQLTYTKDIAPIFQSKCESCHRPDSIAPMSLQTYEEVRPWARSIKDRVAARNMPPWHLDPNVGIQHYKNDRSLNQKQIDTIVAWVNAGAPKGDMKDMPVAVKWGDGNGWNYEKQFGPPDLIVKSPKYTQKAVAMDAWYKPVVETGLTEPRWVRAIEMRPGTVKGRKITHHALAYLMQDEKEAVSSGLISADNDSGAGLFMEWAVNKQGELMRPNTGKLLLPGSRFRWDIHYSAGGEDITDEVQMGIYFYPKGQEPKYRTMLSLYSGVTGGNQALDIQPNSINVGQNFHVMRKAGRVENFQPHMHLRGKAMMVEAILPNGQQQVIAYVPNFEFNWMNNYVFEDDYAPLLPKGTILKITAWHDNTAAKKTNPDPSQWIGWGDRTVDEMAHAWINITYMSDDDFTKEVDARKTRLANTTERQQQ